jgi:putative nucleotidyltransferase with HDIG domain
MTDGAESIRVLENVVGKITRIPALPANIQKINRMIDSKSVTAQAIGLEIAKDMALSGAVLKLVNSGFYGVSNKVSSISHAVVLLGFNVLRSLVSTAWASSTLSDSFPGLYEHSLACSRACFVLGRNLRSDEPEELSAVGLLHDIGKVILAKYLPDEYSEVTDKVENKGLIFSNAEMMVMGVTHAEIGAWLLKKWNLPTTTIAAIRNHHSFKSSPGTSKASAIVVLADLIVKAEGFGWSGDDLMPEVREEVFNALQLEVGDLRSLMDEVVDHLRDVPRCEGAEA